MSWNTVERHGQPPIGSLVWGQKGGAYHRSAADGSHWGPSVHYLPPGTAVTVGELPDWDDVAPPPMSDRERQTLALVNAMRRDVGDLEPVESMEFYGGSGAGWFAVRDQAFRMCADILDGWVVLDVKEHRLLPPEALRATADRLRSLAGGAS